MIDKNAFIPFHHYDFVTIERMEHMELIQYGKSAVGEHFLTLRDEEMNISFSFVSVGENNEGPVYMCVYNKEPFTVNQYDVIRTHNDDFLVHVNHQYDHYDPNKNFIGTLSYHLYQLAKNTLNNEKTIMAYSTLDALRVFESSQLTSEE